MYVRTHILASFFHCMSFLSAYVKRFASFTAGFILGSEQLSPLLSTQFLRHELEHGECDIY
jgi:hypothetical protein